MNKQNQILADYVYLAEASYTDFSRSNNAYNELKDETNGEQPESFAKLVTQNYEVVAHYKDRIATFTDELLSAESSFSGTLFQNKKNKSICLGFQRYKGR